METSWIQGSFGRNVIYHTFRVMLFGTIFHWHSSGVSKSQFIPSTISLLYFIMEMLGVGGIRFSHSSFRICHQILFIFCYFIGTWCSILTAWPLWSTVIQPIPAPAPPTLHTRAKTRISMSCRSAHRILAWKPKTQSIPQLLNNL